MPNIYCFAASALVFLVTNTNAYAKQAPNASAAQTDGLRVAQIQAEATDDTVNQACMFWESDELPSCLSEDIPLPDNFTLIVSGGEASQGEYRVQGEVPESITEMQNFYEQRSEALGWKKLSYDKEVGNDLLRLGFGQGENHFRVTLTTIGNGTRITLETSRGSGRTNSLP